MPTLARALPPALGTVFTSARALELGVSSGRLRARDLRAPFSGVRVVGAPAAPLDDGPFARDHAERARIHDLVRAYAPLMVPHAFVAGRTAMLWHGAALAHGDDIEIGVIAPERAPRREGVSGRMLAAHLVSVVSVDGVRAATPASAWAMLGRELDVRELVHLGDQLVRVPRDDRATPQPALRLATPAQLRGAVDAGRRPGVAKLREALALIRVGSMSPLETDHRLSLVAAGLPEPDLDVEIRTARGRLIGIADAAYPRHRVLIEVEGDHHRTSAAQWSRDLEKHAGYAAEGWDLVRLAGTHIRGARPIAPRLVCAALARAGARLPRP